MTLLFVSFLAGVLTVLAPCILPLLPVVVGTAATGRSRLTPYVVVGSLAASVVVFTFVLKVSTAFIAVPPEVWTYLSGGIIALFGVVLVFPALWERLPGVGGLSRRANAALGAGYRRGGFWGDALVGASLGPIFSTCSPTYFVILASVLPVSFALGTVYIFSYVLGLSLILLLIALLGQRFTSSLAPLSDPKGWVRRGIGALFILVGLFVISGYEKNLQVAILNNGFFDITRVEQLLLRTTQGAGDSYGPYHEIENPSGFVNVKEITIGELVGQKIILVDFMTYSCINCQRTFPHLVEWYEKYSDEGLEIVGIHTPEFAFEKNIENVTRAMQQFGITYPVVLDNDYSTWRAWGNQYWPRKYVIDINGTVVYDHIGEGAYDETEKKIRELLLERAARLGISPGPDTLGGEVRGEEEQRQVGSPEVYFGAWRNEYLGNGTPGAEGVQNFLAPERMQANTLYLVGQWDIAREYARGGAGGRILFLYGARQVFMVASGPATLGIYQDGEKVNTVEVEGETLYTLINDTETGVHTLEIRIESGTLDAYTFTFG